MGDAANVVITAVLALLVATLGCLICLVLGWFTERCVSHSRHKYTQRTPQTESKHVHTVTCGKPGMSFISKSVFVSCVDLFDFLSCNTVLSCPFPTLCCFVTFQRFHQRMMTSSSQITHSSYYQLSCESLWEAHCCNACLCKFKCTSLPEVRHGIAKNKHKRHRCHVKKRKFISLLFTEKIHSFVTHALCI